jgi:hypothetical protein
MNLWSKYMQIGELAVEELYESWPVKMKNSDLTVYLRMQKVTLKGSLSSKQLDRPREILMSFN